MFCFKNYRLSKVALTFSTQTIFTVVRHYMKVFTPIISLLFLITSCATVSTSSREKLNDKHLTADNIQLINGTFVNNPNDSLPAERRALWKKLFLKTARHTENWEHATVNLQVTSSDKLTATLMINNDTAETRIIRFKMTKGYLNLKRQVRAQFPVGPILWVIGNTKVYAGITEENKLVLINSATGFSAFLCLPLIVAGEQETFEYNAAE